MTHAPSLFPPVSPSHLYLIDGSGFIFRAFHALPPLIRSDGTPVNAVLGYCNMLLKLLKENHADYLVVIFDTGRKTFRHQLYPEYKAHRPPPPPELLPQFPLIREACDAFNVPWIERIGIEADDLIASYAQEATAQGMRVTIVSSDKDLMQLITPHVSMLDPLKNTWIRDTEVMEKFGVPPAQVGDVLALMGDASDNIPGVPGIGPKTAAELIRAYGSLENIYTHLDHIPQERRRQLLKNHQEKAFLSKQLVTLNRHLEINPPLEALRIRPLLEEKLVHFLTTQEFRSLLQRYYAAHPRSAPSFLSPTQEKQNREEKIVTEKDLRRWLGHIRTQGSVALRLAVTSEKVSPSQLRGIGLALTPTQLGYISFENPAPNSLTGAQALYILKEILEDPPILKIGHDIKYMLSLLRVHATALVCYEDTLLMSYLLFNTRHDHTLEELARRYLQEGTLEEDSADIERKTLIETRIILRLYEILKPQLDSSGVKTLYERVEKPLIHVLACMEGVGIYVDAPILQHLSAQFTHTLKDLAEDIYKLAGRSFNIGSPKQLGEILFDTLNFPGGKKSKTGAYSTEVTVLENLSAQGYLLPAKILQWRQLSKLKSTYTDALIKQINPQTGRIHTTYAMTATSTGRLASSEPNLQNIPIRTIEGRQIRHAFCAAEGKILVSLDYSQVELRILAHIANVTALQRAFQNNQDIHTLTASEIFGVPIEQMDPLVRRRAKAINFGIIYGMSAYGLAQQLGVDPKDAAQYIALYFKRYPEIQTYMRDMKHKAFAQGYVTTLMGRKCFIDITQRHFAERQAINAPIQGSQADIIKKAMVKIQSLIEQQQYRMRMVLQIHDELLFEAPPEEYAVLESQIRSLMEKVYPLKVPLVVDIKARRHWDEN